MCNGWVFILNAILGFNSGSLDWQLDFPISRIKFHVLWLDAFCCSLLWVPGLVA